jgi:FkbM family methyltransferase
MEIEKYLNFKPNLVCEVGVFTPFYCKSKEFIGRGIETILVEANPLCHELLDKAFGNKKNVKIYKKAISNKNGLVEFYNRGGTPDASAFISEIGAPPSIVNDKYIKKEKDKIVCEAITFDSIDPGNIDILFLDIEGAEWFVLEKMNSRPSLISVELSGLKYTNPFKKEIENWMVENDYTIEKEIEGDFIFLRKQ